MRPRHKRVPDHEVIEIARRIFERGERRRDIAKEYGVHEVWIGRLLIDRADLFHVVVRLGPRPAVGGTDAMRLLHALSELAPASPDHAGRGRT
jgi:hypothetical protein